MSFLASHPVLRLLASPQHLWRTLSLGIKTIWLHKLRSFLTALGVVFGVASVVAMLAIGEGASHEAQEQIRKLVTANNVDRAIKLCSATEAPVAQVARAGLGHLLGRCLEASLQ